MFDRNDVISMAISRSISRPLAPLRHTPIARRNANGTRLPSQQINESRFMRVSSPVVFFLRSFHVN